MLEQLHTAIPRHLQFPLIKKNISTKEHLYSFHNFRGASIQILSSACIIIVQMALDSCNGDKEGCKTEMYTGSIRPC